MASHRRSPQQNATRAAPLAVAAAGLATAAMMSLTSAPSAGAAPRQDADEVRTEVERLYVQAEAATEKYNAARERQQRSQRRVNQLQDQVARGQARTNRLRSSIGSLATAQYRQDAVDPGLQLMLSSEPDEYLRRAAVLYRVGLLQTGELRRMRQAQRALDQRRQETADELAELQRTRSELARHKRTVQRRLAAARRLLNTLTARERAAALRRSASHDAVAAPQPGAGPVARPRPARPAEPPTEAEPPTDSASSARAAAAVAAAYRALGAPYSWASAGPHAFDCSGLTYWAYQQAGVTIPRTSQGQLSAGRRVPLSQARPGDLVVYRADASHVAMYVGNGQVIHAPHPGERVRFDPVDMMPVNAVVRV